MEMQFRKLPSHVTQITFFKMEIALFYYRIGLITKTCIKKCSKFEDCIFSFLFFFLHDVMDKMSMGGGSLGQEGEF